MLEQLSPWVSENLFLNTTGVLLSLVALETVLSADNAIALAALVQHLPEEKHQKQALNWGLGGAFILRFTLIIGNLDRPVLAISIGRSLVFTLANGKIFLGTLIG
jgi:hypothetical protein